MTALLSLGSMGFLLAVAWAASSARSRINWRTVAGALALQLSIGGLVLYVPAGRRALEALSRTVAGVLSYAQSGIDFVFGDIGRFELGFVFAFHVLPVIIFFSSLVAVLYTWASWAG